MLEYLQSQTKSEKFSKIATSEEFKVDTKLLNAFKKAMNKTLLEESKDDLDNSEAQDTENLKFEPYRKDVKIKSHLKFAVPGEDMFE